MGKLLKTKGYPRSVIRNLLFTRMSIQRGGVPIDIQPFKNIIMGTLNAHERIHSWAITGSMAIALYLNKLNTIEARRLMMELGEPNDIDVVVKITPGIPPTFFQPIYLISGNNRSGTYKIGGIQFDLTVSSFNKICHIDGVPILEANAIKRVYEEDVKDDDDVDDVEYVDDATRDDAVRDDAIRDDSKKIEALDYIISQGDIFKCEDVPSIYHKMRAWDEDEGTDTTVMDTRRALFSRYDDDKEAEGTDTTIKDTRRTLFSHYDDDKEAETSDAESNILQPPPLRKVRRLF